MLQEMDIKKALKAYVAGKKVLVMSTSTTDDTGEIMVDEIEKFFPGCRFLVEVPAVVNQEFEEVSEIMFIGICLGAGVALGFTATLMWIAR